MRRRGREPTQLTDGSRRPPAHSLSRILLELAAHAIRCGAVPESTRSFHASSTWLSSAQLSNLVRPEAKCAERQQPGSASAVLERIG